MVRAAGLVTGHGYLATKNQYPTTKPAAMTKDQNPSIGEIFVK